MKVVRDPVWQFIGVILTLIIILVPLIAFADRLLLINAFIAALVVFVLFVSRLRPNKTIFFRVISDAIVLSIKEEEVKGDVRVLYRDNEVKEDIHLAIVRLWNASSEPILPEEYKGKLIKMNFGKEAKVLSAQVSESEPPTLKEEIDENNLLHHDAGNVALKPIWLNTDNSLMLKVLITNFGGEVTTDDTRIIVGGFVSDWNKSRYNKMKKAINYCLSPAIVIISFFIAIDVLYIVTLYLVESFKIDLLDIMTHNIWVAYGVFVGLFAIGFPAYYFLMKYSKKWILKTFG